MNLYKAVAIDEDVPAYRADEENVGKTFLNMVANNMEAALNKAYELKEPEQRIISIKETVSDVR